MAEFINRKLYQEKLPTFFTPEHDYELAVSGALQTAIDRSGINKNLIVGSPSDYSIERNNIGTTEPIRQLDNRSTAGNTYDGISGSIIQGDLLILTLLGPTLTVRSDTFIIRTYGNATHPITRKVTGEAWCEATVQRMADYVNSNENPNDTPQIFRKSKFWKTISNNIVSLVRQK